MITIPHLFSTCSFSHLFFIFILTRRFVLEMLGSEPESRLGVKLKDANNAATQFMRAMEIMHFLHQVLHHSVASCNLTNFFVPFNHNPLQSSVICLNMMLLR
jgi:hypothetical protein